MNYLTKFGNELKLFENLIKKSNKILLINHRRMDGDAYGSLVGFYKVMQSIGKKVKAINDDEAPNIFDFLTDENIIDPYLDIKKFNPDLIISFDAACEEQLGNIYIENKNIFNKTDFVVIDHHPTNPGFGSIDIIEAKSSSTCELTYNILKQFNMLGCLDKLSATALLMGIITDTNSFFNTNSSPESLDAASELMELGARHQDIIVNLFKKKSFNKIKLWGRILEGLKDTNNEQIVWNTIDLNTFKLLKSSDKDIGGVIDEFITTINTLKVAFLVYELPDGRIKATFRGKTNKIHLGEFCEKFGGGGHDRAAGFIRENTNLYDVEMEILNELKKII